MKISCWTTLAVKFQIRLTVFLCLLPILGLLESCSDPQQHQAIQLSGATMGTSYNITVVADNFPEILPEDITATLEDIENSMSTYRPESELMRLNELPINTWVDISPALFEVLSISLEISALSNGAFDITVGPLVNLWGFGPVKSISNTLPSNESISQIMASIGYKNLLLADDRLAASKTQPISMDLSAVAKGYGVDVLAELLDERGVENYLVEIGGEVRTKGLSPRGAKWRIAIESPQLERGSLQRAIEVSNVGMATSGDYRNYFENEGVRYSHTIDPRTGRPIEHKLASVTVIADTTARADALATAFSVLGAEESLSLADQQGIAAYFIVKSDAGFKEIYSRGFLPYMDAQQ